MPLKMKFNAIELKNKLQNFFEEKILLIKPQMTAYSNYVYLIQTEKGKFIYKEYINSANIVSRKLELFIQQQIGFPEIVISENKFRIEKYVEHQEANFFDDLKEIASSLKNFHNQKIECQTKQIDLVNNLLQKQPELLKCEIIEKIMMKMKENFLNCRETVCHNDLQIGNLMKIGDEIKFIDFEYSCMGNPLIDIANLFCETMCNYEKDSILKRERGYSTEQKAEFLRIYMEKEDVTEVLENIGKIESYCHFYWFLWGRYIYTKNIGPSECFNYKEYTINRLSFLVENEIISNQEYEVLKEKFL